MTKEDLLILHNIDFTAKSITRNISIYKWWNGQSMWMINNHKCTSAQQQRFKINELKFGGIIGRNQQPVTAADLKSPSNSNSS